MNTNSTDNRNKPPMKLSEYRSRGREPHVFRAEGTEGLLGAHAYLIASSLKPEEKIRYLLYAPIREAGSGPFGIHAEPASHALAVMDNRFIISKNMHTEDIPPSVQTIPFSQVMCVEIGNALLLGWLAIRFIEEGQVFRVSLFYTARGSHHFENAVREFRKAYGESKNCMSPGDITWAEIWENAPTPQIDILKSIMIEEEKPAYLFRQTETWGARARGRKQVCLAPAGVFLVTNYGFIHALDERRISPHILSYGVNVSCIPPGAVSSVSCLVKEVHGICRHILRLQIGKPPAIIEYEVPFEREKSAGVDEFVRTVQEMKK